MSPGQHPPKSRPSPTTLTVSAPNWRMLSATERLAMIPKIFLYTSAINDILLTLEYNYHNSAGAGEGIILSGPPSVGKTALLRTFLMSHPGGTGGQVDPQPVVICTPTSRPDAAGFAEAIIRDAKWPLRSPLTGGKLPEIAVELVFRSSLTKVLFINRAEFLAGGDSKLSADIIPFLVNLLDRGDATIVLVSDESLPPLISDHPLLDEKFWTRKTLKPFELNAAWENTLKQFEMQLPFKPGLLCSTTMPHRLYLATAGRLPPLSRLTRAAARLALFTADKFVEELQMKDFRKAYADHKPDKNPFDENADLANWESDDSCSPFISNAIDPLRISNRAGHL